MPTDLYLIRHGEAVANVEPIIGGMRGDVGLTELGRKQAELLEQRLRAEQLRADQLYVSTLPRALETGEYVARALQLPIQRDDDLQELRPGEADGLSLDEWRRRFGEPDGSLPTHLFRPFSPGGESWAGFLVRAGGAWPASSPNMRTRRWWRCATVACWRSRSTSRLVWAEPAIGCLRPAQHQHHALAPSPRIAWPVGVDTGDLQRCRPPGGRRRAGGVAAGGRADAAERGLNGSRTGVTVRGSSGTRKVPGRYVHVRFVALRLLQPA